MTAIAAGKMDRLIRLEGFTDAQDATGQPVRTYALLAEVWAEYVPLGGRELLEAQQNPLGVLRSRWRIRYRDDVDEAMQIVFKGVVWGIESVAEMGRGEGLEIVATRKRQSGDEES